MDCRNVAEATKMATSLYKEAIHVPFMAKFCVFSKRHEVLEARMRVFCMTDDKEEKTLEHQEHFHEIAKSRDVEVLEGKTHYLEFFGNLFPGLPHNKSDCNWNSIIMKCHPYATSILLLLLSTTQCCCF